MKCCLLDMTWRVHPCSYSQLLKMPAYDLRKVGAVNSPL